MKSLSLFEEIYIFQSVPLVYITNRDFIKLSNDDLVFYVNIVAWYQHQAHISPEANILMHKNMSCGNIFDFLNFKIVVLIFYLSV